MFTISVDFSVTLWKRRDVMQFAETIYALLILTFDQPLTYKCALYNMNLYAGSEFPKC